MPDTRACRSWTKRILLGLAGLLAFILLFIIACRLAAQQMFFSIEQSRAMGLSALAWTPSRMWSGYNMSADFARADTSGISIAHSARLRSRTSSFDHAIVTLQRVVVAHGGYFDDLRTQSTSGQGRLVAVELSFLSSEFEGALSDLKKIGEIVANSEMGQDAAVELSSYARRVAAAQTALARLQKLQRERNDELLDALAL
jgi:Domain of unknown function (DUF4349)